MMLLVGLVALAKLYLTACFIRWKHGRHYMEKFTLMNFSMMADSWDYMRFDPRHKIYKCIIISWTAASLILIIGGAWTLFRCQG